MIKLVGYTMQLRPEHMRILSPQLGLDYEEDFLGNDKTDAKRLLMDQSFGYSNGLHEPSKMLVLGFLYCRYANLVEHMENLWHLINPNFKARVSMRVVRSTLEDLLYVAIDPRLNMLRDAENLDREQFDFLKEC